MNKKLFSLAAFVASLLALSVSLPAFAANTYTRSIDGPLVTAPVSFHYDYTDWDADVLPYFSGSGQYFQYFLLHVTNGVDQYNSALLPCIGIIDYYCSGTSSTPKFI